MNRVTQINLNGQCALYIPHNGFTRQMSADEVFTECLSEGDSTEEAGRRAGFAPGAGGYHAKQLRKKMGAQGI